MVERLGNSLVGNPGSRHGELSFLLGEWTDELELSGHGKRGARFAPEKY